jgi:hypothetical protein
MTVLSFAVDDRFVLRTIKSLTTNPDNKWANSYEAVATETGDNADLISLGLSIVAFERAIHQDVVQFLELLVSTWEADSVPYDPTSFLTLPLTGNGSVGVVSDLMALNTTLSVARVVTNGRSGHLFYRGVLQEGDVEAPAGKSVLVDRDGFQDTLTSAVDAASLDEWMGPSASNNLRLAMISASGLQVRAVQSLRVQGVSSVPTDHAWFNRSNPI